MAELLEERVGERVGEDEGVPGGFVLEVEPAYFRDAIGRRGVLLRLVPGRLDAADGSAEVGPPPLVAAGRMIRFIQEQLLNGYLQAGLFPHLPSDTLLLRFALFDSASRSQPV